MEKIGVQLEEDSFADINLAAYDWIVEASRRLVRGFLLLIDYGHEARELYSATHAQGTLTSFRAHASESRDAGPGWLREPGLRDLTSHVDLTGIRHAAESEGLVTLGILDQGYFLLGLGLEERLSSASAPRPGADGRRPASAPPDRKEDDKAGLHRRLALKTLLLPGGLGSTHKVMIFGKGVGVPALRGTAFRRLT
jgi:SAM-dependent MidA family methyltransferase